VLIDLHVHYYDEAGYGEALAETAKDIGMTRLCIAGGQARHGLAANAEVRRQADAYPELFLPFASLRLGEDSAGTVERFRRVGFEGLSVDTPPAPYDDPAFYGIYEAAQALSMPVVFHTCFAPRTALDRAYGIRSANMRPVYLDTIARSFPALKIVGVALGHPWCEEAVEAMRIHSNVFFDFSGDLLRRRGMDFFERTLRSDNSTLLEDDGAAQLCRSIVFGSGVRHEEIASSERDYQRILRALAMGQEDIDAVMGGTAARLLGIRDGLWPDVEE
jgi:predicted TIM-barrel fold metal-dependent hydrolase